MRPGLGVNDPSKALVVWLYCDPSPTQRATATPVSPGDPPRSADRLGPDFYEVTTSALVPVYEGPCVHT